MEEKTRRRRPKKTTEEEDAEKPTRENDRRADRRADRRRRRGEQEGYQGEQEEKKQKTGAEDRQKKVENPLQVFPQKLHDLCAHRVIQQRGGVELARHFDEGAGDAGGFECRDQGIRLSYRGDFVGRMPDEEWRI